MPAGSAIAAGRAAIGVFLDDSKLSQGLRGLSRKLRSAGATLSAVGGGLLGGATAAAAAFLPTITAASDMQETMSKFDTVFAGQAAAVKEWSDNFAGSVGRSKKQIADFMASSQDLFVPLGFDDAAAQSMSKTITGLSVDLASFNNMQDADTLRDLHAALTGSGEVMKKYGVIVSEAAVKQEMINKGLDPKTATEQQKVQARLAIIMRGTTAAQGDAIKTSGSFANQMKRVKATIDDTKVAIGSALLPIITPLITRVGDVVKKVADWAAANPQLIATIAKVIAAVGAVGGVLLAAGGFLTVLGFALPALATGFSVVAGALGLIVSPAAAVLAVLTGIGIAIFKAAKAGAFDGLLAMLQTAAAKAGEFLAPVLQLGEYLGGQFMATVRQVGEIFGQTFQGVKDAVLAGDWQAVGEIVMGGLKAAWLTGVAALTKIWEDWKLGVIETFAGAMIAVTGLWQDAIQAIANGLIDLAAQDNALGTVARKFLGIGDVNAQQQQMIDATRRTLSAAEERGDTEAAERIRGRLADLLQGGDGFGGSGDFAGGAKDLIERAAQAAKDEHAAYWSGITETAREMSEENIAAANRKVDAARRRLTESTDAAAAAAGEAATKANLDAAAEQVAAASDGAKQQGQQFSLAGGSFDAFRLGSQFAGNAIQKQQLDQQKQQTMALKTIETNTRAKPAATYS